MSGGDDSVVASGSIIPSKVNIKILGSSKQLWVRAPLNSTVKDFKPILNLKFAVSPEDQLLIYNGRVMADHRTLNSYGLEHDGTVDLIEYRDAARVSAYFAEDSVGNLGNLNVSGLEDLAGNPETIRILHRENTRMRAICDRNLGVLSGLNDLRPTPPLPLPLLPPRDIESSSLQLGADGNSAFRIYQSQRPPLPATRPTPRVADRDMLPPNPQTQEVSPEAEIEQTESQQNVEVSLTLKTPQTDGGTSQNDGAGSSAGQKEDADFDPTLATPQNDGGKGTVPQNDEGTSAGGDEGDRLFNLVRDAYAHQLSQLLDMGFSDTNKNTVTLFATRGDVVAAIEQLGGNQSQ